MLQESLRTLDDGLQSVLLTIADCVADVQDILQQDGDFNGLSGTTNTFGDQQLQVDCAVDDLIFKRLAACPACCAASSEEQPDIRQLQGNGYTVVFDPLDGSSIIGANFAVGSIFGVWPGYGVVGRCGRQQVAAAYAVYGPRTMLVMARPSAGPGSPMMVQQFVLQQGRRWRLLYESQPSPGPNSSPTSHNSDVHDTTANGVHTTSQSQTSNQPLIAPTKRLFAPANLRCCAGNAAYRRLVDKWVDQGFTLRYTGGMVPDVHHILAKGGGVFVNPCSSAAPAKLRLVYECAPLALIIEAAGGASHDGHGSILDARITSTANRSPIVLGSSQLVQESLEAMRAHLPAQSSDEWPAAPLPSEPQQQATPLASEAS